MKAVYYEKVSAGDVGKRYLIPIGMLRCGLLNTYIFFLVSALKNFGYRLNGCTWCRLLTTHVDDMMRRSAVFDSESYLWLEMNIERCHDSRITPAGSFDLKVALRLILSSKNVGLGPSLDAQVKDCDEDWTGVKRCRNLTFNIFANSSDPAARAVPTREIQPVVHSPEAIAEIKRWIESCADHVHCSTTSDVLLPTRVIEVSPTFGKHRSRLLVTNGLKGRYNTLSYCWGTQSTVLTHKNLAQFQKEIDLSILSKTVQDAIEVTISLGVPYLWIDAMCILQDCPRDKAMEISRMASIYQSSHITIVAASAKNANEGFLLPREAPSPANTIPCMHNGSRAGTVNIREGSKNREEPVDSRAWTLQEQLLSQRLLVYSTLTLQWRCKGVVANLGSSKYVPQFEETWWSSAVDFVRSEPVPLLINQDTLNLRSVGKHIVDNEDGDTANSVNPLASSPGQPAAGHKRIQKLHIQWPHLIERYSLRSMTYASDKLVALAGIAEKFGEALETRYVAGFWEDHMLEYLMWDTGPGATETSSYRAPSWSWASLDGAIIFDSAFTRLDDQFDQAYDCRILRCQVTLKDELLPYGEVIEGHIELSAVLRRAWYGDPLPYLEFRWLDNASPINNPSKYFSRQETLSRGDFLDSNIGSLDIRTSYEKTSRYKGEVFCVALWIRWGEEVGLDRVKGLMLMHKGNDIYERIGTFASSTRSFDGIPLQTITII